MWAQLLGWFLINLVLASIKMLWHRRKGEVGFAGHPSQKADGDWIFVSCEIKYFEAVMNMCQGAVLSLSLHVLKRSKARIFFTNLLESGLRKGETGLPGNFSSHRSGLIV